LDRIKIAIAADGGTDFQVFSFLIEKYIFFDTDIEFTFLRRCPRGSDLLNDWWKAGQNELEWKNKVAENESAIGISFPKYKESDFPLGDKLRLFSETQEQFKQLELKKWFNRLTDYTHCTSIKEVPKSINQFACFQRKRNKGKRRDRFQLLCERRYR